MSVTPTPLRHPLLRCADVVLDAVAEARGSDPAYLAPAQAREALVALTAAVEQLRALQVWVMAHADEVALEDGARSVAAWMVHQLRVGRHEAAAAERLGEALVRRWDLVREAFADGRVNEAQARAIVKALDDLPDRLGPDLRARAEAYLVEQAAHFGPRELKALGGRLLEVLAPEIVDEEERRRLEAEERAARRSTRLTMHVRGDGATDIRIRVPDHVASRLKVYLESLTSPRRPGAPAPDDEVARLPYPRRLGGAFCALLERLPAKLLPQHGGTATTVMATVSLEQFRSALGAADLGSGERITAGELRRLACNAHILPVVLGGDSEILDLGRARRLFSGPQRKAMAVRDRTCRAQGCSIPAAWCEAHHLRAWKLGGKTDLADGVLLCGWHHHRAHDDRFHLSRLPNGDVRFARRT